MHTRPLFARVCALYFATLPLSGFPAGADTFTSGGKFVDKAGMAHPWHISASHVLVWDDKPWVPVGGRFQVKSWAPRATDADFDGDKEAFLALKKQGVRDVLLQPSRGGLTGVPTERIQKIIDFLDAEGFTYGVSIADGPQEPLLGYDVRPGKYRAVAPEEGGLLRFPVRDTVSGLYFVATEGENSELIQNGDASPVDEGLRVVVGKTPGRNIVFAVPQKAHLNPADIGMPNVWEGFDAYRDQVITSLRRVKWGSGLRFWVDGLTTDLNPNGEADAFVPSSTAFQTEFADALARRYKSIDALQNGWAVTDRQLLDFKQAAGLIPLWGGGKGVQYFYDPAANQQLRVNTVNSQFWQDLTQFKNASLRGYMNDLATVLKKTVADVPVVYRSRGYSPLFANLSANSGFDGVGIEAYGRGSDLVTRAAGYTYAQTAEATKTLWMTVIASGDAAPGEKTSVGYASRVALHTDLDWLRGIGARGFYVDGLRLTDPARKAFDLSQVPTQWEWLADYERVLTATGISQSAPPTAVFFPRDLAFASQGTSPHGPQPVLQAIGSDGWWLPSDRFGTRYDLGAAGWAYELAENDGSKTYYLWNPRGTRQVKIKMPKTAKLANGAPPKWSASANGHVKGDILTLTVGPEPVRLENFPTLPVPTNAFEDTLAEAVMLTKTMRRQSQMDAGRFENEFAHLEKRYNPDSPRPALMELQELLEQIRTLARPYAWLEAEKPLSHSFDMVSQKMGASGSQVLVVEARGAGLSQPLAAYTVNVRTPGQYNVWVAATPHPPLSFRLDGAALLDDAQVAHPVGSPYADGTLVWTRLGTTTLPKGTHTLEMRASGPAVIDTLLLIQGDFTPNGTLPPPVQP